MELLEDIQSDEVFTQFTEVEMAEGLRAEQFGSAQLRDHNLTQAWRDVQVMVGQKQDGGESSVSTFYDQGYAVILCN